MRHILIVATAFRLAGFILAIASVAMLVDLADTARVMRQMPPPETGQSLDIGTYGLIALIVNAASGFAWVVRALASVAGMILVALAIAAMLALLFSLLLYLTGRGIRRHATWARIVAMLISIGFVLVSCAVATAGMRWDIVPFAALAIGLSLYALWALIWRFA